MSLVLKQFGKEVSLNAQTEGLYRHEHNTRGLAPA